LVNNNLPKAASATVFRDVEIGLRSGTKYRRWKDLATPEGFGPANLRLRAKGFYNARRAQLKTSDAECKPTWRLAATWKRPMQFHPALGSTLVTRKCRSHLHEKRQPECAGICNGELLKFGAMGLCGSVVRFGRRISAWQHPGPSEGWVGLTMRAILCVRRNATLTMDEIESDSLGGRTCWCQSGPAGECHPPRGFVSEVAGVGARTLEAEP